MLNSSSLSSQSLFSSISNGSFTMPGQSSSSRPVFPAQTVSTDSSAAILTPKTTVASSTVSVKATTILSSSVINSVTTLKASSSSLQAATTVVSSSSKSGVLTRSMAISSSSQSIISHNNSPVVTSSRPTTTMPTSDTAHAIVTSSSASSSGALSTKPSSLSKTSSDARPPAPPSSPFVQSSTTTSSHPAASTLTSVTVVKASTTPRTSTVTKTADTTLSSAVAVTTTNVEGAKIITTPPLVTLLSTSTEADGALTTVTNIVANPPNMGNMETLSSNNNLLHKQGVLAAICLVAGILAATLIIGIVLFVRRSNRLKRHRRWLAGMQRQRPHSLSGDPFHDPQDSFQAGPTMRSVGTSHEDVHQWEHKSDGSHHPLQEPTSHDQRNFFGGLSILPDPHPTLQVVNRTEGDRQQYLNARLAYTTDLTTPMAPFRRHSMAPSSPSIYPASLPDEDDEHEARHIIPEPPQKDFVTPVSTVPPRPPRSHLRESAKFGSNARPLTPPDSSHTTSQPPSPSSEPSRSQDVFGRRTILDVRNR